jgi:hypothetical protein
MMPRTPPTKPSVRPRHGMRLVLVPAHMLDRMRSVALGMVTAGGTLDTVLKMRCRSARRYGAPSRRNTCYEHLLMEVQAGVLSRVFPRQRGVAVKLGNDIVARRYSDRSVPCTRPGPHAPLVSIPESIADPGEVGYI